MTGTSAEPDGPLAERFARTRPAYDFRLHQREALERVEEVLLAGVRRRAWVVLPPGSGKTLVGLETVRRLGAPAVVLGPNTAIQAQWVGQWREFTPPTVRAGTDRALETPLTVLTYQALATFDPDAEVDEEGHAARSGGRRRGSLLDQLHPNGRALVERMRGQERLTLVLDECHHLLEVWGRLIAELLELLPQAHVLGLTATPPSSLSRDQARLVDELFGEPLYAASIPAVVREGHLAPFAELAWLTTPTAVERTWLAAESERFRELTTDLADPSFGTTPFLTWLDRRFVVRRIDRSGAPRAAEAEEAEALPWSRLERAEPDLAAAALRMHHAGLLALPEGARVREEHRHPPDADDWVLLLQDWLRGFLLHSEDPADAEVLAEIRRALPSVGHQLTARGIRAGRSPVDRVLARSEGKAYAAVEIVGAEHAALGDRLRMLVLCDHERAAATLPATLRGVLSGEAGSARLLLERLLADRRTTELGPMLVTGRTVAAGPDTAKAFRAFVAERTPGLELELGPVDEAGVVELLGRWSSRTWVPLVTAFVEAGHCGVLVGTRALLGEGWDARGVSGVVDLTTATTPTAVVQTRGRALRTDPSWPEKVAATWTVVCVTEDHPKGTADWARFVRKHQGYLGLDEAGEIVDGVAHVDREFSPYAPPAVADFDAVNAAMLARAERRSEIRALWRVGTAYDDRMLHTLRIRPTRRAPSARAVEPAVLGAEPPGVVPAADGVHIVDPVERRRSVGWGRASRTGLAAGAAVLAVTLLGAAVALGSDATGVAILLGALALVQLGAAAGGWLGVRHRLDELGARIAEGARPADPARIAFAVADALRATELTPVGAEAVVVDVDDEGAYRIALSGVGTEQSDLFATALDEALGPLTTPRYVVPRYLLDVPADARARRTTAAAARDGRLRATAVIWHAVPTVLGTNAGRARAFGAAWGRWVSASEPLYTGSAEGEGVLATHRGADPLDVTTALRLSWE